MFNQFLSQSIFTSTLLLGLIGYISKYPQNHVSYATSDDRPLVVATTSVLCDLTEQIAEETINLECLIDAGVDPHVYQPLPQDRQIIDSADLILYGGYNFEESVVKLIDATSNEAPKVPVFELAVPNPLMGEVHDHDHDHDHGEEESVADPHVWHNPNNGIAMAEVISEELEQLQPDKASLYEENFQSIKVELTEIDQWIRTQITTIAPENRKLVTTHDALGYYIDAYNLEFEGALAGFNTEESPTATRVSELVKTIQASQVPTIFAENSVNPRLIETVAREANVKVSERELYADGLGEEGTDGDTYQKMLIANTKTIVEGLGGDYQPFYSQNVSKLNYTLLGKNYPFWAIIASKR